MKSKICTTINQSKKLIELGIPKNTADMWYQHIGYSITDGKEKQTYFPMVIRDNISDDDIPAWSLSALLKLIPNWTMDKTDKVNLTCNPYYHCESCYEEPVDAVFEIVCWLKENNKI